MADNIAGEMSTMGLASGLAQGIQSFYQGRLQREQERLMNDEEQQAKVKGAQQYYDSASQMVRENPSLRTNPQFLKSLNANISPLGFNFGNQLPDTFGEETLQEYMGKNPNMAEFILANPKAAAQLLKGSVSGTDQLETMQPRITNPSLIARFQDEVLQRRAMVNSGVPGKDISPTDFVHWIKTTAPTYSMDPDSLFDESTINQMQAGASARLDSILAHTNLTNEQFSKIKQELPFEIQNLIATGQYKQAATQKQLADVQNASVKLDLERQNIDLKSQQLILDRVKVDNAVRTGNTQAMNAMRGNYDAVSRQADQDRNLIEKYKALNTTILATGGAGATDAKTPLGQQLEKNNQAMQAVNDRLFKEQQFLDSYQGTFQKQMTDYAHGSGVPGNTSVTKARMNDKASNGMPMYSDDGGVTWIVTGPKGKARYKGRPGTPGSSFEGMIP